MFQCPILGILPHLLLCLPMLFRLFQLLLFPLCSPMWILRASACHFAVGCSVGCSPGCIVCWFWAYRGSCLPSSCHVWLSPHRKEQQWNQPEFSQLFGTVAQWSRLGSLYFCTRSYLLPVYAGQIDVGYLYFPYLFGNVREVRDLVCLTVVPLQPMEVLLFSPRPNALGCLKLELVRRLFVLNLTVKFSAFPVSLWKLWCVCWWLLFVGSDSADADDIVLHRTPRHASKLEELVASEVENRTIELCVSSE